MSPGFDREISSAADLFAELSAYTEQAQGNKFISDNAQGSFRLVLSSGALFNLATWPPPPSAPALPPGVPGATVAEPTLSPPPPASPLSSAESSAAWLYVRSNLTLVSYGEPSQISGGLIKRVFAILPDGRLELVNVRVTSGYTSEQGGAILVDSGTLVLRDSEISDSQATQGGGAIAIVRGEATIERSRFTGCISQLDGGAILADPANVALTLDNVSVSSCIALGLGGALAVGGASVEVEVRRNCSFTNCTATGGGSVSIRSATVRWTDSTIANCRATGNGGGFIATTQATLLAQGCTVFGCTAARGGGLYAFGATSAQLTSSSVIECSTSGDGGGLYASGAPVVLEGCSLTRCSGRDGGVIYSTSLASVILRGCSLNFANATRDGGGAFVQALGTLRLEQSAVSACGAARNGGGIAAHEAFTVTLSASEISGCAAVENGGGAWASSTVMLLEGSTIRSSQANASGGALLAVNARRVQLTRSLLTGCVAGERGGGLAATLNSGILMGVWSNVSKNRAVLSGGALHVDSTSFASLQLCRMDRNVAPSGGAISLGSGGQIQSDVLHVEHECYEAGTVTPSSTSPAAPNATGAEPTFVTQPSALDLPPRPTGGPETRPLRGLSLSTVGCDIAPAVTTDGSRRALQSGYTFTQVALDLVANFQTTRLPRCSEGSFVPIGLLSSSGAPICGPGATCIDVSAAPEATTVGAPTSPVCTCPAGSTAASSTGESPSLAPFLTSSGCETPLRFTSLTRLPPREVLVRLQKNSSGEAELDAYITLHVEGTKWPGEGAYSWSISEINYRNDTSAPAAATRWLSVPTPLGALTEGTLTTERRGSDAHEISVQLRMHAAGLQERSLPYDATVVVHVTLEPPAERSIVVRAFVNAAVVGSQCSLELLNPEDVVTAPSSEAGTASARQLRLFDGGQAESITYLLVARDADGMRVDHGGDPFNTTLTRLVADRAVDEEGEVGEEDDRALVDLPAGGASFNLREEEGRALLTYQGSGLYWLIVTPPATLGTYSLHVALHGVPVQLSRLGSLPDGSPPTQEVLRLICPPGRVATSSGGCSLPVPIEDKQRIEGGLHYVAYALMTINWCLALGFIGFIVRRFRAPVVQASQPIFLAKVAAGALLSSSTILFLAIDDSSCGDDACIDPYVQALENCNFAIEQESNALCANGFNNSLAAQASARQLCTCLTADAACMAAPWTYCCGFVLIYAPLFSKLWRMHKTFGAARQQRRLLVVRPSRLYGIIIVMASVEIFLLALWQLCNPLVFVRETTRRQEVSSRPTASVGQCKVKDPDGPSVRGMGLKPVILAYE